MAPVQTELQVEVHNGSDVIALVNQDATWRDVLLDLVDKEKLDPWNIDIIEVVDGYVSTVKKLKVIDFRVPANIILAAAILLRMKANVLSMPNYDEVPEMVDEAGFVRPDIMVDPLNLRLRVAPKRRISLNELISALDEAMKIKDTRLTAMPSVPMTLPITLENFDIETETERIYQVIKKNADRSRMLTFTHLTSVSSTDDVLLGLFIPLLFLAHKEKVTLIQEKFFSEIIISLK